MVTIRGVAPGSPADRAGIRAGETLVAIGGNEIIDALDYRFYMTDRRLEVTVQNEAGERRTVSIRKREYDELGLEFDGFLFDGQQSCKNKCIFCFIDQLPKGMRPSLYFKDDDARLSFLFGNYITLTNLSEHDLARILAMHISPINVSVHTTNPELRVRMMKNPHAAELLPLMRRLIEGGIKLNAQLVLCPGINDGAELERTLADLEPLIPGLESIACVPVGLTDHRAGLEPLEPYTAEGARAVIETVDRFAERMRAAHGMRVCYPSDEFFLRAGLPIPAAAYYEDFNQLDNGVGLMAILEDEFRSALRLEAETPLPAPRRLSIATGTDAAPFLRRLVDAARGTWHTLQIEVHPIENDFFGHRITVAGLVTGGDILRTLRGRELGEALLLPAVMLRHERDRFLDDMTPEELEAALGVPVRFVENDGFALLDALLGR